MRYSALWVLSFRVTSPSPGSSVLPLQAPCRVCGGFSSAHPCQGCNKALQSTALSCLSSTSTAEPKSLSASHFSLPKSAPDSVGLEQANELVIITPASSAQPQGPTIINDLDWNLGLTATFPKAHSSSQLPGKSSGLQ